jgi:hypothetical protein
MICVVLLQDCVGFVGGETGYCSETCVTGGFGGTGEGSVGVEEAIDVKDEMPEFVIFPLLTTEQEVRLWGVCEVVTSVVCEVVTAVVCEVTAVVCEEVTAVCEVVTADVLEVVTAVVCEVVTAAVK